MSKNEAVRWAWAWFTFRRDREKGMSGTERARRTSGKCIEVLCRLSHTGILLIPMRTYALCCYKLARSRKECQKELAEDWHGLGLLGVSCSLSSVRAFRLAKAADDS